jgi:hypothetical protein
MATGRGNKEMSGDIEKAHQVDSLVRGDAVPSVWYRACETREKTDEMICSSDNPLGRQRQPAETLDMGTQVKTITTECEDK